MQSCNIIYFNGSWDIHESFVRDSVPRSLPIAGQGQVRCLHPGHSDTETQQQGQHGGNKSAGALNKTFPCINIPPISNSKPNLNSFVHQLSVNFTIF